MEAHADPDPYLPDDQLDAGPPVGWHRTLLGIIISNDLNRNETTGRACLGEAVPGFPESLVLPPSERPKGNSPLLAEGGLGEAALPLLLDHPGPVISPVVPGPLCRGRYLRHPDLPKSKLPGWRTKAYSGRGAFTGRLLHADETGWKERAKRAWLWTATTLWVTVFLIRPRRWTEAAKELLGEGFAGQLVTDRCGSYRWVDHRQRQLCWAHLLRDFRRIAGREGAPGRLGRRLERLGAELFHEWHRLQAGQITRTTFNTYASRIRVLIRQDLESGSRIRHAKTAGTCICDRLRASQG